MKFTLVQYNKSRCADKFGALLGQMEVSKGCLYLREVCGEGSRIPLELTTAVNVMTR